MNRPSPRGFRMNIASGRFGYSRTLLDTIQAFHFKVSQAGEDRNRVICHGHKMTDRIARIAGRSAGGPSGRLLPPTFQDLINGGDFARFSDAVREDQRRIPHWLKMSAQASRSPI